MIETSVRSENLRSPNKPIYIVGDSLGACLALAVAARNPELDLVLILANPGEMLIRSNGLFCLRRQTFVFACFFKFNNLSFLQVHLLGAQCCNPQYLCWNSCQAK